MVFDPSSLIYWINNYCEENQFLFKNKNSNLDYISGVKSFKKYEMLTGIFCPNMRMYKI